MIDGNTGRIEVRVKHPRRDPVKARDLNAELEDAVRRFFDAQRARAFGIAEDFTRELAGTLRRAMRNRG